MVVMANILGQSKGKDNAMSVTREGKRATATALAVPDPLLGFEPLPAGLTKGPKIPTPLDECARFQGRYVYATPAMIDAMTLVSAVTWVADRDTFATLPRCLWWSEWEESGKTNAMNVTASLSYDPVDLNGTSYAMRSKIARAGTEGRPCPTLFYDEISKVFGKAGTRGDSHPVAHILTKGYKSKATDSWSVDRSDVSFSIFSVFMMTGLRTAVPRDIRTRCILFPMEPGTPREYFDARDAEREAELLAASLSVWVRSKRDEIKAFRVRRLGIPRLTGRRAEVWEALFAVANAAGPEWLNRCYTAFCELALDEAENVPLTPEQTLIRDLAAIALHEGTPFIGGYVLADELSRMDSPLYAGLTQHQLACKIREALPFPSRQVDRKRGYFATDLVALWDAIKPEDDEVTFAESEAGPFDVTDDMQDDTDAWPVFAGHTDARTARTFVADSDGTVSAP